MNQQERKGGILGMYGIAPAVRTGFQFYIIYLAVILKVKIPFYYFLLYGISNLLYTRRMYQLNSFIKDYPKLHGFNSVYEMPLHIESVIAGLMNVVAGFYLMSQKR